MRGWFHDHYICIESLEALSSGLKADDKARDVNWSVKILNLKTMKIHRNILFIAEVLNKIKLSKFLKFLIKLIKQKRIDVKLNLF